MAYTLVDIDSPVSENVIEDLSRITGALLVRYLPILAENSD
jgi:D-3-phosphoglycerate dehydrogenase